MEPKFSGCKRSGTKPLSLLLNRPIKLRSFLRSIHLHLPAQYQFYPSFSLPHRLLRRRLLLLLLHSLRWIVAKYLFGELSGGLCVARLLRLHSSYANQLHRSARRMSTLAGHLIPGLYLAALGIWHLFAAINSYLKLPREYSARLWHPVAWLPVRAKHLELYAHLALIPLAIAYQLLVTKNYEHLVRVSVPAFRVMDYQHVALLFLFWLLAVIVLISEVTLILPLPGEAYFLLSAVAFGVQWIVLVNQGQGLEGKCNSLLAGIAAVCAGASTLLSLHPRAFLADLMLFGGVLLQGLWMIQSGLSLYVEKFIPDGCHRLLDLPGGIDGSTRCDLEEAKIRAMALMDLSFIIHVIGVIVFSLAIYGLVARFHGYKRNGGYEPLSLDTDSNHVQLKPMPKQAQF